VEIAWRADDAAAHHDGGAVLALYDPEVVLDMSHPPYSEVFEGASITDTTAGYPGAPSPRKRLATRKRLMDANPPFACSV
jgi:hypothetical protein